MFQAGQACASLEHDAILLESARNKAVKSGILTGATGTEAVYLQALTILYSSVRQAESDE